MALILRGTLLVTTGHYLTPPSLSFRHNIFQWLNFLSMVFAAMLAPGLFADQAVGSMPQPKGHAEDVFDRGVALASADGDMKLLAEVVGIFLEHCPKMMSEIDRAIREENASGLDRAAHAFKGSVCNFGARTACAMALELEMRGKSGELAAAGDSFAALEQEIERLKRALGTFVGGTQS